MKVWIVYSSESYDVREVFSDRDAAIRSLMDYYDPLKKSEHWSESQLRKYVEARILEYKVIDEY